MTLTRGRRVAVWVLLVSGVVVAVLAMFAVWAARQLLDEDRWQETNTALIADPAVQAAVAGYLVDQLYDNADLTGTLADALPARLQPLAAPAVGAAREPLVHAVERLLDSAPLQELWATATRAAHRRFMSLVEERGTALRTPDGGGVVLDLRALLIQTGQRLGLPITGQRLPDDAAVIQVLTPDQLRGLQTIVKLLKTLAIVLFALAVVLLGAAVWSARGRRRETAAGAALAVVVAAVLVLLMRRVVGDAVVGELAPTAAGREAAAGVWTIGTSVLAQVARTALLLALVLLLATWLAGPAVWARRLRGRARPALLGEPALVHGATLALLLGLLTVGVVPGVRTWAAAGLLVVVCVGGVELVRRAARADALAH